MIDAWLYCIVSILVFGVWMRVQKKTGLLILNPLLGSVITLVILLSFANVSYEHYMGGAQYISFFIEPCVVALGYPLFKQIKAIGRQWRELTLICLNAVFIALTVSALLAKLMGIEDWVIRSLVTLCITTAIAMETTEALGGSASLAAVMVMIAGFTGSALGIQWLYLFKIRAPHALGMAMGSTAHALGTATITAHSHESSAYSSTALIICAIITAIVAPVYIPYLLTM